MLAVPTFTAAPPAQVLKIVLNDTIQPITDEFIGRALTEPRTPRDAVLIEINTPGGLVDSTREIIEKIVASSGAGYRLCRAQRFARGVGGILHPGSGRHRRHGSRHEHRRRPSGLSGRQDGRRHEDEKMENDAAAFMRSFVSKRGRNVEVGRERCARVEVLGPIRKRLQQNLIDSSPSTKHDLFRQLDGKPIKRFDGKTVTPALAGQRSHVRHDAEAAHPRSG